MTIPDSTEALQRSKDFSGPRIDLIEAMGIVWQKWKLLAFIVGTLTAISIIVSLILSPLYKSTATILPETDRGKLASLGGLSDLAALAGVNVGSETSLIRLYPTIVTSEAVLKNVIYAKYRTEQFRDSVNLIQYWGIKDKIPGSAYESVLKKLRLALEISTDVKTSVIALSIETEEPNLSSDILNKIVAELDEFIRTKRTTSASEQRRFVEGRLAQVNADLESSENALKDFRERNLQVRSPQLLLVQGRLERDVQMNTALFVELKRQYEISKIEEVKNLPIINILDKARPAIYKESPRRSAIVIFCFLLGFVVAIMFIVGDHYYRSLVQGWIRKLRLQTSKDRQ